MLPIVLGPHYLEFVGGLNEGERYFVDEEREVEPFTRRYWYKDDTSVLVRFWYRQGTWTNRAEDGFPIYALHFIGLSDINDTEPPNQIDVENGRIPPRKKTLIQRYWEKLLAILAK